MNLSNCQTSSAKVLRRPASNKHDCLKYGMPRKLQYALTKSESIAMYGDYTAQKAFWDTKYQLRKDLTKEELNSLGVNRKLRNIVKMRFRKYLQMCKERVEYMQHMKSTVSKRDYVRFLIDDAAEAKISWIGMDKTLRASILGITVPISVHYHRIFGISSINGMTGSNTEDDTRLYEFEKGSKFDAMDAGAIFDLVDQDPWFDSAVFVLADATRPRLQGKTPSIWKSLSGFVLTPNLEDDWLTKIDIGGRICNMPRTADNLLIDMYSTIAQMCRVIQYAKYSQKEHAVRDQVLKSDLEKSLVSRIQSAYVALSGKISPAILRELEPSQMLRSFALFGTGDIDLKIKELLKDGIPEHLLQYVDAWLQDIPESFRPSNERKQEIIQYLVEELQTEEPITDHEVNIEELLKEED